MEGFLKVYSKINFTRFFAFSVGLNPFLQCFIELGNVSEADIDLINKFSEEYTPPAYIPFSNGNSLGAAEVSSDTFILDPDIVSTLADIPDPIDESKPVTTVQVRTLTGQRLKIRINLSATILQLATCIKW